MNLLCFDISSSGITAALLNSKLETIRLAQSPWNAEALRAEIVIAEFEQIVRQLKVDEPLSAVCIGTFMHNFVLLDGADQPLTPLFTWLDHRGQEGIDFVRARLGDRFHKITGCHYHPMFPIFKLASLQRSPQAKRIVSIKALLIHRLTGRWTEDHGIASASGLFNVNKGDWDSELLALLGLNRGQLPDIGGRNEIAGNTIDRFGLPEGISAGVPVINGSGDGFLANVGSDCETPSRVSVTLGTSAVVRQTLPRPVLHSSAGTFCYQADTGVYLLGCAGSNGGNVLDWGRKIFGAPGDADASAHLPIFIPLLHGERSPDWNPNLTGSWHGLTALHTAADLSRSIFEGVVFNLAHFIEIVQNTSEQKASDVVLSGNGFRHPLAAPTLAAVTGIPVSIPGTPGVASLRGAAICGLRALGQPVPPLAAERISALADPAVVERYRDYRRFRSMP
jgi:gluconokinase